MPKLKTHRGAAKRFRKTKGGLKCRKSNRSHILTKERTKVKRHRRSGLRIHKRDAKIAKGLLTGN